MQITKVMWLVWYVLCKPE